MKSIWNGFEAEEFEFEGKKAIIVFPKVKENAGNWCLKTEYWNGFPQTEIELVKRGFHLCFVENESRFATKTDCERKARFVKFVSEQYGLRDKCITIGYSCGGAHAVNFAGFFPECVSGLFIDAPVLNFCDYPGRVPDAKCESVWEKEFVIAYPGITRAALLDFNNHPMNKISILKQHKIPIIMLYGTEDQLVKYNVNGKLLEMEYAEAPELLTVIQRYLNGHHPHGFITDTQGKTEERLNDICELIVDKLT
jgi:dienelactone hydrolase